MIPMLDCTPVECPSPGTLEVAATTSPDAFVSSAHRAHAAVTYAVAMKATRDPELAEDLTQEAFVRLLTEARAGRYPDNTGAWLYRAVSNLVISRARRAEVARRLAPRLADVGSPDQPDVVAVRHEGHAELRRALATLSTVERTALLLAASGASGVGIAARLGRSHGATRALLCRARTRLREQVAAEQSTANRGSTTSESRSPRLVIGAGSVPHDNALSAFPVRGRTSQSCAVTRTR